MNFHIRLGSYLVNNFQNTNFWGPVYATHFAIPHIKKTKGKIIAVASPAGWSGVPRMSIYAVNGSSFLFLPLH